MVREQHQPTHDHRSQGEQLRPLQAVHRCIRARGKDVPVRAVEGVEGLRAGFVNHVPALHGLMAIGIRVRRVAISSPPRDIQTAPTVTARGTFQPYHRLRQPRPAPACCRIDRAMGNEALLPMLFMLYGPDRRFSHALRRWFFMTTPHRC